MVSLLELSDGTSAADTLILDLWPPELREFLLLWAAQLVVIYTAAPEPSHTCSVPSTPPEMSRCCVLTLGPGEQTESVEDA